MPAGLPPPPPPTTLSAVVLSASPSAVGPGALPPFARYASRSKVFTLAVRRSLSRRKESHSTSAAHLSLWA